MDSPGSGFPEEAASNPLLNHAVLQTFFQLCDLKDLRRFRLVSKLWHDLSLPRWRNEMVIYVGYKPYHHRDKTRLSSEEISILHESPSIVNIPFRKYVLGSFPFPRNVTGDSCEERTRLETFWKNCGPWMRELEVYCPQIDCEEFFRKAIVEYAPNVHSLKLTDMPIFKLRNVESEYQQKKVEGKDDVNKIQPNLKMLSVNLQHWFWDEACTDNHQAQGQAQRRPIPWYQLFLHFPNVQKLEWDQFLSSSALHFIEDVEKLKEEGRLGPHKLKIKVGDVNRQDSRFNLSSAKLFFKHGHVTIEKLGIELANDVNEEDLGEMLNCHRGSLISLDVCSNNRASPFILRPTRNPILSSQEFLTELNLNRHSIASLDFLEFLPNLRKLILPYQNLRNVVDATDREKLGNIQLTKLHHLQVGRYLRENEGIKCESAVNLFLSCMPNVKIFKCPLTTQSFRRVCERWKELEEVEDPAKELCDEGITGIVPGLWDRLPNITDLKCLREFRTKSRSLSDQSVWGGFLQIKQLTSLQVELSHKTSNKSFSTLFSRFRTGISRRCGNKYDDEQLRMNEDLLKDALLLSEEYDINLKRSGYLRH